MSAMIYQYVRTGKWDLIATMNGSLAGLVIVTPGCAFIAPLPALLLGLAGGVIVLLLTDAIEKMKIDDAVGAFAVHAGGGITGIIGIGLFAEPSLTGFAGNVKAGFGGLLIPGGSADILITQVIGIVAVIAWCAVTSTIMFAALQAVGLLRVHPDAEKDGMFIDAYEHGQTIMPDLIPLPEERAAVHGRSTVPAAAGD
jgi:Amt family ammonium transporter